MRRLSCVRYIYTWHTHTHTHRTRVYNVKTIMKCKRFVCTTGCALYLKAKHKSHSTFSIFFIFFFSLHFLVEISSFRFLLIASHRCADFSIRFDSIYKVTILHRSIDDDEYDELMRKFAMDLRGVNLVGLMFQQLSLRLVHHKLPICDRILLVLSTPTV